MGLYIIIGIILAVLTTLYIKLSRQPRDVIAELTLIGIILVAWPLYLLFIMVLLYEKHKFTIKENTAWDFKLP